MMHYKIILLIIMCLFSINLFAEPIIARTDGSLGQPPQNLIPNINRQTIISEIVGKRHGENVFHSFEFFNIPTGHLVKFITAESLETKRIIARITGDQVSTIAGELSVDIPADFYLINPAGIIVSETGQINVNGKLYLDTGGKLLFENGETYSADLSEQSTLSIGDPTDFGFLERNVNNFVKVQNGSVIAESIYITTHDLELQSGTLIARDNDGANVQVRADTVELNGNSSINANLNIGGGFIDIAAVKINMSDNSTLNVDTIEEVSAGIIDLKAEQLQLSQHATLSASTLVNSQGKAGIINIDVLEAILSGDAWIVADSLGTGESGDINISAEKLILSNNSVISTMTFGVANAGNLLLQVSNDLMLLDQSLISSGTEGVGSGGNVIVVIRPNETKLVNLQNISVESVADTNYKDIIVHAIGLSYQAGVSPDEHLFTGGGTKGQLFIIEEELTLRSGIAFNENEDFLPSCSEQNREKPNSFHLGSLKGLSSILTTHN